MRVTNALIRDALIRRVNLAQSRRFRLEEQAASGRRVTNPADDPTATAIARRLDAAMTELDSFAPAANQVKARLETSDATLGSVFDQLIRIKELALTMSNGTASATDRAAAADEAEQIRVSIIGLANTKMEGEYLFGGMASDIPPALADGTWVGNAEIPEVEISPGVRVAAMADGVEAFTAAGGVEVFQVLQDVQDALLTNDVDALRGSLDTIEQAQTQVRMARSRLGPVVGRVDAAEEIRDNLKLQLIEKKSNAIDADLPETISQLTLATQSLEASLSVTARALSHTLLDKIG